MLAKAYLQCRMDQYVHPLLVIILGTHNRMSLWTVRLIAMAGSNLMAPDEFKNLGFGEDSGESTGSKDSGGRMAGER